MRLTENRMKMGVLMMSTAVLTSLCLAASGGAGAGAGLVNSEGISVMSSSSMGGDGKVTVTTTTVSNGVSRTVTFTTNGLGGAVWASPAGTNALQGFRRFGGNFLRPVMTDTNPTTWLGVSVDPLPEMVRAQLPIEGTAGVLVRHVAADSPASKAGLRENDVLLKLDDQQLFNHEQLRGLVSGRKEGDTVTLSLLRKGKAMSLQATLAKKVLTEADEVYDVGGWNMAPRFLFNMATNGAVSLKRQVGAQDENAPVTFEDDPFGGTNAMSRANLERIMKQRELARKKKQAAIEKEAEEAKVQP